MIATRLRTEYLQNPLGIDIVQPRLFWVCEGGVTQLAYQVVARRSQQIIWDTGRVESARTTAIAWHGPALGSRDAIEWSVRLWDETDTVGDWQSATFELGLLDASDWVADWITGDYTPKKKTRYPVDSFRTDFEAADVQRARLYVTACGLYETRLNGERVGQAVMTPGFTDYRTRLHYQTYDVNDLIRHGVNTLEIDLADGWYRGAIGAMGIRNAYGRETKLLAQLEVLDGHGGRQIVATNRGWAWSNDGPIRFADMKDGEIVDLHRAATFGGTARATSNAVIPTAANNVPVLGHERFTPSIGRTPTGKLLLDFGQNIAGYVELNVTARSGDRIALQFAEHLDAAGELDMASIQVRAGTKTASPKQEVVVQCKDGTNHYTTRFAVFGFRYAVAETELHLEPDQVTAIAVYSAMEPTADFDSSSPLINKLVENTLWSMKGNFLDVPTDCPTRERAPWTGDAQIFCRTGTYLMDTAAFMRKWLQDLRDSQRADGRVPCHAPDVHNNEFVPGVDFIKRMDGAAGWADAAVLVPVRLFELHRDEQTLRLSYESMRAHVRFQVGRTNRTGLFGRRFREPDKKYISNVGQAFGEWLEPRDVYQQKILQDFVAPHPEEATAYLAYVCALMVQVATTLGHGEDIAFFEEYRDGCRTAYANQFTPDDTDRQSKLVRPLALGLLDESAAHQTFDRLIEAIEARDYRIGTGFLSTPLILPLLTRMGRTDVAYRMLENEAEPGWLFEVRSGATTVWENWDGSASQNHYSPGSVCQWLFETVCGIDVLGIGHFGIAPQPGGSLAHASLTYRSMFGPVSSAWKRTDTHTHYEIVVPANTTATITLPSGTVHTVHAGAWSYDEPHQFTDAAISRPVIAPLQETKES